MMETRYFVNVVDNPDSPKHREITSLYRWIEDEEAETLITDRWNEQTGEWDDDPSLLDVTGLGGPAGFIEVELEAAKELAGLWRRRVGPQ